MDAIRERRRDPLETTDLHDSPAATAAASTRSAATPRAAAPRTDEHRQEALERLPVAPDYGVFLAQLRAAPAATHAAPAGGRSPRSVDASRTELVSPTLRNARDVEVQQRLDSFRDRFAGPYTVDGSSVEAPPMFRMNTSDSFNAVSAKAHAAELHRICAKAGVSSAVGPASVGRGSPEQLVKVTQALIDAGKLPPADAQHATLADRVRGMQWTWGVGVDCAGYTQQAAAAANGPAGSVFKGNLMGDMFVGMARDRRFQAVDPADIRPGDVIHLNADGGGIGHNVICYARATLGDAALAKLRSEARQQPGNGSGPRFLSGKGPFHAYEVDSSWGAGDGLMVGGFRRDTWVFDETSRSWASYPSGDRAGALNASPSGGPQDELFGGAFRPRDAR